MLRRTVAGGIDHIGKVSNPETLERAPRYEYDPGNIFDDAQRMERGYPHHKCVQCLVLKSFVRRASLEH